jgi:hypothetical protein
MRKIANSLMVLSLSCLLSTGMLAQEKGLTDYEDA